MSWPFAAWHRIAVRHLHLAPDDFWDMPLADWLALISPDARTAQPKIDRAALTQMMKDHPDDDRH